jgi:hypothetical protein
MLRQTSTDTGRGSREIRKTDMKTDRKTAMNTAMRTDRKTDGVGQDVLVWVFPVLFPVRPSDVDAAMLFPHKFNRALKGRGDARVVTKWHLKRGNEREIERE